MGGFKLGVINYEKSWNECVAGRHVNPPQTKESILWWREMIPCAALVFES